MKDVFKAVKVTDKVYWVGAVDWSTRDFHGYSTDRGTTYNAYLVLADKITLVDTVKAPYKDELLARIASLIDPADIAYVISNHSEMDHSGCLPEITDLVKPERVFASSMGVKALSDHFHSGQKIVEVKDGESISLGSMKVTCYETRMLHWPDSMVSYLAEERVLFSQDGFGMHLASSERFDDEIEDSILEYEAAKYYANILLPFSNITLKVLEKLMGLGIEIDIIAPDHGPIWRDKIDWILSLYTKWARREPKRKAVIVYDTMWGSTEKMARAIEDGLAAGGVHVVTIHARRSHRSTVAAEILDAGALVVGSPTINNNIFPALADTLTYLKGLKPRGLVGAAFGSYGWSGESVKEVEDFLHEMKVELVSEGIRAKYVPDRKALTQCLELGEKLAERLQDLPRH